jgi:hypothetical protein
MKATPEWSGIEKFCGCAGRRPGGLAEKEKT